MTTPIARVALRRLMLPILVLVATLSLGGFLTVENKEYLFLVRPDGSGQGRIVFENIASVQEDGSEQDQATKDYTELLTAFIKGKRFETENPALQNVKKRLYEEGGKLYGEVTFDFLSYEDVGLYRFEESGPWMYHAGNNNELSVERLVESNGTFGGPKMPVIFWKESTSEFRLRMAVEEPEKGVTRSLLPLYKRIGVN